MTEQGHNYTKSFDVDCAYWDKRNKNTNNKPSFSEENFLEYMGHISYLLPRGSDALLAQIETDLRLFIHKFDLDQTDTCEALYALLSGGVPSDIVMEAIREAHHIACHAGLDMATGADILISSMNALVVFKEELTEAEWLALYESIDYGDK